MSRFRPDALSEGLRNFFSKKESNEKKPPAQPVRPAAEVEPVLEKIPITSIQNENEIHKPEYSPELTQEELETLQVNAENSTTTTMYICAQEKSVLLRGVEE